MSSVAYIKQKAIEIANNSSHKIIVGVMSQKDVEAGCSAVFDNYDNYDNSGESEYCHMDSYLARKKQRIQARIERRDRRKAQKNG